jgi:hypothetical protein
MLCHLLLSRSQWPRGLRRRSTATRLLRSWVRITPGAWMLICCVLSGRCLCDDLITRPRGVLPTVARRCVWSRNLMWRGVHGFEYHRRHGCLLYVFRQRSLRRADHSSKRSPTDCGASLCVIKKPHVTRRSWVRIPPGAWVFVCCVLSGRDLCDELITRPRGVLPTVVRHFVWSRNLMWRGVHEKTGRAAGQRL